MKTLSVGDFKAKFSDVVKWIQKGEVIAVTFSKSKKVIGYFSAEPVKPFYQKRRKLGILENKIKYKMRHDWSLSDAELVDDIEISS